MTRPTSDDPRVARALGASVFVRAIDAAIETVWDAAGRSRTGIAVTRFLGRWRDQSPAERSTGIGVALLSASLVYTALMITHEMPPGWLWVVPPAVAATIGLLLLLASPSDLKA